MTQLGSRAVSVTRFTPPGRRSDTIERDELVRRVLTPTARLVVVSSAAGTGKSTILAQAHAACTPSVWLSLDPIDDDPAALWTALIESTRAAVDGFEGDYLRRVEAAGAEAIDELVPRFVNELAELPAPITFFLDDLHLVSDERSIASLERLVRRLPPGSRAVIASRHAVPFPVARRRLDGDLIELGAHDLAMSATEARALLAQDGAGADAALAEQLVARTEGWAAGLSWAAAAIRSGHEPLLLADGVDAELTDYLVEELLLPRNDELRSFLLDTAFLDRMTAELCDAVRGRTDSRELLSELERTNSFVIALDRTGEWFRYHHLVRDVLVDRIGRPTPEHRRRAARWLSEDGQIEASFLQLLAAGDRRDAADVLCANWWAMFNRGRMETARMLFEQLGTRFICSYQPAAIAAATFFSLIGEHRLGETFFEAAEAGDHDGPPPDGSASMESSLAIMRAMVGFGGVEALLADSRRAVHLETPGSPWTPVPETIVAIAQHWRGDLADAEVGFERVAAAGHPLPVVTVAVTAHLSLLYRARNDRDAAVASAGTACAVAADHGLDSVFVAALAHGAAACADIDTGAVSSAGDHLDAARRPMQAVGAAMPLDAMHARLVLADASLRLGRLEDARDYLTRADEGNRSLADTGVLTQELDRLSHELRRTELGVDARPDLSERELDVLDLLQSNLTIREVAERLYVSRETVRSHRRRIFAKLGVNSREDAVDAARAVGLLGADPVAGEIRDARA